MIDPRDAATKPHPTIPGRGRRVTAPVLVVGEALVDIVGGAATPGGSPANVAVGLARLDVPVELATRFGADKYGVLLAQHLAGNGVRLGPGAVDPAARTATAVATLDSAGIASYDFDIDWRPVPPRVPDGCVAVHTGSIATVLEPGASTVGEFVRSLAGQPITVCLDPNARPAITPDAGQAWTAVAGLAAYADLVKLSEEDCAFLRPGLAPAELAAELLDNDRTRCIVVTLGADGALAVTEHSTPQVPAPQVDVVDTVGAGDSFMSALIAGLHTRDLLGPTRLSGIDDQLPAVLDTAVRAAAITCTRPGADPPTLGELG
jgi:fructokinase